MATKKQYIVAKYDEFWAGSDGFDEDGFRHFSPMGWQEAKTLFLAILVSLRERKRGGSPMRGVFLYDSNLVELFGETTETLGDLDLRDVKKTLTNRE